MKRRICCFLLWGLVCAGVRPVLGQWTTQTIPLQPGWNAVYLEVQPGAEDCDAVFGGLPVESVWAWNQRFSTVQFIQDPNQLLPGQPNWLTYLPPDHAARATRNLYAVRGGQAYLIKLKSGAQAMNWIVAGQPVMRPIDWRADSFNFTGFPVAANSTLNFQSYFAGAPAHEGKPIYRLNAGGQWELIASPATTLVKAGQAYWVYCEGSSSYPGPLQVETEAGNGLIYGRVLTEQTVRIRNAGSTATSFSMRELASGAPPGADQPVLAGDVPLAYFRVNAGQQQFGWVPLTAPLQQVSVGPGQEWVIRLEARRSEMAPFVPPPNHRGVLYQSLLEITNASGARVVVPVSAEGLTTYPVRNAASPGQVRAGAAGGVVNARAGLWVGTAALERVNQPASIGAPNEPTATASPFQFRIILHVDNAGNIRLLQKVLQMFKEGTLKPDPADASLKVVDQPGRYVLVTDESLIPSFSGSTLRDGQSVARRISTAAFGFKDPLLLAGVGEFGAGKFRGTVVLGYDDPLNPFKHRYHPDHDNLNDRFEATVPEGTESFTVSREIELEFTAEDPDHRTIAGWGDNQLGGIYRETVTGLHSKVIYAQGTFRLTQASRIGVLNDGR